MDNLDHKTEKQADEKDGHCRQCNRCMPCPAGLVIGKINLLVDQYMAGDGTAKEQYHAMKRKADNCFQCGACEQHCPFGVKVKEKMLMAREIM